MPKSGLLQSGLITLYMMYLTWSSMANNPDGHCNPLYPVNNSTETTTDKPDTTSQQHMDTTSIIGLVIWFLCLLYSSVRTASSSQAASKYDIFSFYLKSMRDCYNYKLSIRCLNFTILIYFVYLCFRFLHSFQPMLLPRNAQSQW